MFQVVSTFLEVGQGGCVIFSLFIDKNSMFSLSPVRELNTVAVVIFKAAFASAQTFRYLPIVIYTSTYTHM